MLLKILERKLLLCTGKACKNIYIKHAGFLLGCNLNSTVVQIVDSAELAILCSLLAATR